MNKNQSKARTLSSIVILLIATSLVSGQPLLLGSNSPTVQSHTGAIRLVRISVSGESVTITCETSITDAVSYMSGERFVVIIPQAVATSVQGDSGNRNFTNFQIEQRGEDVSISFLLKAGTVARLDQKQNGLSVQFSSTTANSGTTLRSESAGLQPEPVSFSKTIATPQPQPPSERAVQPETLPATSAAAAPLPQQQLAGLLNQLFPGASDKVTSDTTNVDLSVPESPAFAVLGLTPNTVVRPASPKAFASSLLNGLDQNGNFQSGLAIDTAPFMLFNGENITIRDYNEKYLTRFLTRTQFSFAAAKAASTNDKTTKISAGLNLTLWDRGDPRVFHPERGDDDVLQCFANNLKLPPPIAPNTAPDVISQINAANKAANDQVADACRERARKANWNRSSWIIAYAPSWISKTGETSGFKWNGGAAWTSLAYGFEGISALERIAQLILHARHRTKEQVPDRQNAGKFLSQDSTFFGARFRAGSAKFAFNFEDIFIRSRFPGGKIDNINRFSIGAEARITDNLYFVIASGSNLGADNNQKKGFVMSSFKYGFTKKSQFNPQP